MSRPTKPWFRKSNKKWYVWHDGKQVNLGPDKKEAHQKFHQLMAEPKKAKMIVNSGSLIELVDSFLEWWWIGSELPDGVAKEADPLQQDTCYWNAITRCIGKSNWVYYEGYAAPGEIPDCTPLQHAWCIRGGEQLIDATWPTPKDSSYFGIQFATQATIQLQGGLSWKSDEDTMLDYLLNNPGEQISYIVRFAALES